MAALEVSSSETSPSLAAIVATADDDIAQFRNQTSPNGLMTIVFTDIEGSTEQMESVGEERWLTMMRTHNRMVRECVADYGGEVVKSRGDGFMAVFASTSSAQDFAVGLQQAFAAHNRERPDEAFHIRIGLHTGKIFEADDDFLGRAVVLAARLTGQADGGQILVSETSRGYTIHLQRWTYGAPLALTLKGLATEERAYPLEWSAA